MYQNLVTSTFTDNKIYKFSFSFVFYIVYLYIIFNGMDQHITDIAVCPHAGGVGLCEMVQHLQTFYLIRLAESSK